MESEKHPLPRPPRLLQIKNHPNESVKKPANPEDEKWKSPEGLELRCGGAVPGGRPTSTVAVCVPFFCGLVF